MDEVFKHGAPFILMKAAQPEHAVNRKSSSHFRAHNVCALVSLAATVWLMIRPHGLYGNILIQLSVVLNVCDGNLQQILLKSMSTATSICKNHITEQHCVWDLQASYREQCTSSCVCG